MTGSRANAFAPPDDTKYPKEYKKKQAPGTTKGAVSEVSGCAFGGLQEPSEVVLAISSAVSRNFLVNAE